jgi:hypothetical protein
MEANLEGRGREAVVVQVVGPAARGKLDREVGAGRVWRIVLRRATTGPQPTLAGYTRRSWGRTGFPSGPEA